MKTRFAVFVLGVLLASAYMFSGCSQEAPVGPVSTNTPAGIDLGSMNTAAKATSSGTVVSSDGSVSIQMLQLPAGMTTKKAVTYSKKIIASQGGFFNGTYSFVTKTKDTCKVSATLYFPQYALSRDTTVSMTFDPNYAQVNFTPHGLVFAKSVMLAFSVVHPVTPTDGTPYNLYYIDDLCDPQPASYNIQYDFGGDQISTQLGLLAHFSRYAFGH